MNRKVTQCFEEESGDFLVVFEDLEASRYFILRDPSGSSNRMNKAIRAFCSNADYFINNPDGFIHGFISIPEIEFCDKVEILDTSIA